MRATPRAAVVRDAHAAGAGAGGETAMGVETGLDAAPARATGGGLDLGHATTDLATGVVEIAVGGGGGRILHDSRGVGGLLA